MLKDMLPDPEAAIGCIPDEMQKGPDKPRF